MHKAQDADGCPRHTSHASTRQRSYGLNPQRHRAAQAVRSCWSRKPRRPNVAARAPMVEPFLPKSPQEPFATDCPRQSTAQEAPFLPKSPAEPLSTDCPRQSTAQVAPFWPKSPHPEPCKQTAHGKALRKWRHSCQSHPQSLCQQTAHGKAQRKWRHSGQSHPTQSLVNRLPTARHCASGAILAKVTRRAFVNRLPRAKHCTGGTTFLSKSPRSATEQPTANDHGETQATEQAPPQQ